MTNRELIQQPIIDKIVEDDFHGIINLATGVGKTRIIIKAIEQGSFKSILWLCATDKFRDEGLYKELDKWSSKDLKSIIKPICWESLENHKGEYDLIVADEIQKITPARNQYFLKNKYNKILGATGTMPRSKEKKEILKTLNLVTLWSKDVDEAVDEELISDYTVDIVYVDIDDTTKITKKTRTGASFIVTEKSSYDWYCRKINELYETGQRDLHKKTSMGRARFLYNSETKLRASIKIMNKYKHQRLISFSKSVEVAERLSKCTFHSKLNKDKKKENYNNFNEKKYNHISTVEAANTSLNFIDLEVAFITQLDSNPGNLLQRMGRVLRFETGKKAKIVILCMKNTRDEDWVLECIQSLDSSKINHFKLEEYI